jgi:hypothetical protein
VAEQDQPAAPGDELPQRRVRRRRQRRSVRLRAAIDHQHAAARRQRQQLRAQPIDRDHLAICDRVRIAGRQGTERAARHAGAGRRHRHHGQPGDRGRATSVPASPPLS